MMTYLSKNKYMKPTTLNMFHVIFFRNNLKSIRKKLGYKCTHLANCISLQGKRTVEAKLDGVRYYFEVPDSLTEYTQSDFDRLEELMKDKLK